MRVMPFLMHFAVAAISVLCLLAARPAAAADAVRVTFGNPRGLAEELPHLGNKVLIAEPLDPDETGLGLSAGFVLWQEILSSAIVGQRGAGVTFAYQDGVSLLEDSYHLAAIEIAKTQRTWITFWSVVEASGDDVFLQAFISIVPVVRERVPLLDVEVDATPVQGLSIDMPRTRFGFRIQKVTKRLLNPNGLKVFTKRSAGLRQGARENSDIVVELPSNKQALVLEMEGEWLYVRVTDPSKTGYLNLEDVLPVAGPRRLELPVIEFIAGLIAYQAGNYEKGRGHFKTFIEKAGPDEDRANLAAAHQMLGAISLRRNALDESALHDFDSAISLTPYDPHAYLLRSVAQVGYSREADVDVLAYVEKALELDHLNPTARALISAFAKVNAQSNPKIAVTFEPGALTGIQKKYGIAPR